MKKLVLVLVAMLGLTSMSAQEKVEVKTDDKTHFMSVGHSFSSSAESYPTLEFGYTRNDVSYSMVFGCFDFSSLSSPNAYFIEYKIVPSTTIGKATFGFIIGAGSYLGNPDGRDSKPFFGEIGAVVSYNVYKKFNLGVSYSNWDTVNYITPSLTYNF
jgi:hypothetical protein